MKYFTFGFLFFLLMNCDNSKSHKAIIPTNPLVGTWKMIYAETKEDDSVKIKDLTSASFIKILNDTHFAFFNQPENGEGNFYGGGGTYTLNGKRYIETLNYTSVEALKNHEFPFIVAIKGDTLIQSGLEEVKEAGIKREIIEKYVRLK